MSTSLKRLFKVLLIFPTLRMGLYFLTEKGTKADQSFSLKFSQNHFNLIRDIFFNIRVEIADESQLNMLLVFSIKWQEKFLTHKKRVLELVKEQKFFIDSHIIHIIRTMIFWVLAKNTSPKHCSFFLHWEWVCTF